MPTCPFGGSSPVKTITGYENIRYVFDEPRVGGRYITKQAFQELALKINEMSAEERDRLVSMLIDLRQLGQELPEVTFDLISKAKMKPTNPPQSQGPGRQHMDAGRRMLNDIAKSIRHSGEEVLIRHPVPHDQEHVLVDLIEAGLVRGERGPSTFEAVIYKHVRLTDRGLMEAGA